MNIWGACWLRHHRREGCFNIRIASNTKHISARYQINLNNRDILLIHKIQEFFGGVGHIYNNTSNRAVQLVIEPQVLVSTIIPHFNKYLLHGNKHYNFLI